MRVELDRTVEPTARDRGVAQTALDHAPVEELEGVAGAEAEQTAEAILDLFIDGIARRT